MSAAGAKVTRILWNDEGANDIDEVVVFDASCVHIEKMDKRCWWIQIDRPDGTYWSGNFVADSRGRMRFMEQENAGIAWDDDRDHVALEAALAASGPLQEDETP